MTRRLVLIALTLVALAVAGPAWQWLNATTPDPGQRLVGTVNPDPKVTGVINGQWRVAVLVPGVNPSEVFADDCPHVAAGTKITVWFRSDLEWISAADASCHPWPPVQYPTRIMWLNVIEGLGGAMLLALIANFISNRGMRKNNPGRSRDSEKLRRQQLAADMAFYRTVLAVTESGHVATKAADLAHTLFESSGSVENVKNEFLIALADRDEPAAASLARFLSSEPGKAALAELVVLRP